MEVSRSILKRMPDQSLAEVFRDGELCIYGGTPADIEDCVYHIDPIAIFDLINFQVPRFGTVQKTFDDWITTVRHTDIATWFRVFSDRLHDTPRVWMQGGAGAPIPGFTPDLLILTPSLYKGLALHIDVFKVTRPGVSSNITSNITSKTTRIDNQAWADYFKKFYMMRDKLKKQKAEAQRFKAELQKYHNEGFEKQIIDKLNRIADILEEVLL